MRHSLFLGQSVVEFTNRTGLPLRGPIKGEIVKHHGKDETIIDEESRLRQRQTEQPSPCISPELKQAGDEVADLLVQLTTLNPLTYPLSIKFHAPAGGYLLRQGRANQCLPLGDDQRRLYVAPCADTLYDVWPVSAELVKQVKDVIASRNGEELVRLGTQLASSCPVIYSQPGLYELVEPRMIEAGTAPVPHGLRERMMPLNAAQANRQLSKTQVWLQVDDDIPEGTAFFRWGRDAFEARLEASRSRRSRWALSISLEDITKLVCSTARKNNFSSRVTEPNEGSWRISVTILKRYHHQPAIQEEFGQVTARLVNRLTDEGLLVDLEYYKVSDPLHSVQILAARDDTVLRLVRTIAV